MPRLKIAGIVYVEYKASPLEIEVEDLLREIGTALGPMKFFDIGKRSVACCRESIKKVKGITVTLHKLISSDYSAIPLSDLLEALGDDGKLEDQMLDLQRENEGLSISAFRGEEPKLDTEDSESKQMMYIRDELNKVITHYQEQNKEPPLKELYHTAIEAIPKSRK